MPNRIPVDDAEQVLRDKVAKALKQEDEHGDDKPTVLLNTLEGFKQFAQTQFEVSDSPDSDGCLVEYGVSNSSSSGSEFYIHLVRQFEQLDEDGDHGNYIQTYCDIAFSLDDELKELGHQAQWWFRSSGDCFDQWWRVNTSSAAWMKLVSRRIPKSVEFFHDIV